MSILMKSFIRNTSYFMRSMSTMRTHEKINPKRKITKNQNTVRLIGSVSSDVHRSTSKQDVIIYLSTYYNDKSYDIHKVVVPAYSLEKLPGDIKKDQQLLITGKIRSEPCMQDNGKKGSLIQIIAKQVFISENDSDIKEKSHLDDQNHVEIEAYIWTEVKNRENFAIFHVDLRYLILNVDGVEEERCSFVPVFVYDDTLRNVVKNQLQRRDRVQVDGALKYKPYIDSTGKKQYLGYVEANRITKLLPLQKTLNKATYVLNENH